MRKSMCVCERESKRVCVRELVCVCLSFQTEIMKNFLHLVDRSSFHSSPFVSNTIPLQQILFKSIFGAMSFCLPVISPTDILPIVKHFYHCHDHIKTYTTCHKRNDIRQDAYRQNDYRQNGMSPFFCKVHPTHCSDNLFYPTLLGSN